MTDNLQILLWGRTVERLLIVFSSGLSLVLGWNLFRVRLLKDQTAEFASRGWTIRLERVGPGIFFALFGVVGLMFAVAHPLNIGNYGKAGSGALASGAEASQGLDINWSGGGKDVVRDELRAINTLESLGIPAALEHPNSGEREALNRAKEVLDARRAYLLRIEFGDAVSQYEKWKSDADKNPAVLTRLSKSESDEFRRMDNVAKGTFVGPEQ